MGSLLFPAAVIIIKITHICLIISLSISLLSDPFDIKINVHVSVTEIRLEV